MARNIARLLLVLIVLGTFSNHALGQGGNSNPGVAPPNAHYRGLTYGEWEAKCWQALFAIPVVGGDHPQISGGAFGGEDGVLFLAAVVGAPVTIDITIPAGTPLFLRLLTPSVR